MLRRLPLILAALTTTAALLACEGAMSPQEAEVATTEPVSTKDRLAGLPATDLVNPTEDAVMQYVVSAVPNVTDEQIRGIYDLYTAFRADQAKTVARMARMRASLGRAGEAGQAPPPRRGQQARLDQMETDFLAAGRLLLTPEQYPAWDECAVAVDLSPPESAAVARPGAIVVGAAAPPFTLNALGGGEVSLAAMAGKPVIVEFGSYTCPIFRGNAAEMRALATKYADKAHFVLVYGYEAHTNDGWQVNANQRDGILYNQPTTLPERVAIAKEAVTKLSIASTVAIDGLDNAVTDGWEGHPNVGVIIGPDGKVVSTMGIVDPVEIDKYLSSL
jgi:hypothetical protein